MPVALVDTVRAWVNARAGKDVFKKNTSGKLYDDKENSNPNGNHSKTTNICKDW